MSAIENAGVLRLDAELGPRMPVAGLTLTTHRPLTDGEFLNAARSFWRAFRKRWGRVEYCGFIEWTTGKARRSGGIRRMHAHYLVKDLTLREGEAITRAPDVWRPGKGAPPCTCASTATCVECWTRSEWKALAGAWVVNARPIHTPAGAVAYLALHHQKRTQAPPRGWTGKRFRPSQGYFNAPVEELRVETRLRLAEARAQTAGRDPSMVRLLDVFTALKPRVVPEVEADAVDLRGVAGPVATAAEAEAELSDPEAPINQHWTDSWAQDVDVLRRRLLYREIRQRREDDRSASRSD